MPVSNDPNELIRHKWISETYQLLKTILPPKAVDTPEELAQLSQFVVNIVNFRDPDGTMTHFLNPDVIVVLGKVTTYPATAAGTTPTTLDYNVTPPTHAANTYIPLDQYGMEYNPIAINETLAYSFLRFSSSTPTPTNRFFVELVNTLTKSATGAAATLDLTNWDIVITADDPVSRPDPFTGQLLPISVGQLPLPDPAGCRTIHRRHTFKSGTMRHVDPHRDGRPFLLRDRQRHRPTPPVKVSCRPLTQTPESGL